MRNSWGLPWSILLIGLAIVGCSGGEAPPELATVKGKVTVDGAPGAELEVVFEPQTKSTTKAQSVSGSGSSGTTDAAGNYELSYLGGANKGAVVGMHTVRVINVAGGGPAGGATGAVPSVPIPATYNTESTLTFDVKKGENKDANFDLKTK